MIRLLVWLILLAPAWAQDRILPLTILHTNDLHAHLLPDEKGLGGFAQLATLLREQRANCASCLYLNAGDLVQGTPVSTLFRGMPIYEIANKLGIDASTLGNHEFDYGWQQVPRFLKTAHFPVVSANMVDASGEPVTGKPYVILKAGELRVAVIGGLMSNMVGTLVTPQEAGPWRVLPLIDTVRRYVRETKDRSDVIVVLGHILDEEAESILRDIPEVSVVVAGHSHRGYPDMKKVGGGVAVLVRGYGVELGRLDLKVNITAHKLESAEWKKIPIDSKTITPDPAVARDVAAWEAKVSQVVDVRIGQSRRNITIPELNAMVARAMKEASGADFAYVNKGNIRDNIPAGTILARQIWNMLPFDNHVVVGKMKGSRLPPSVIQGRPVDPEREYTLATTDYSATIEFAGVDFTDTKRLQRDVMIDWIKTKKIVD